jgi:hypothetical protein
MSQNRRRDVTVNGFCYGTGGKLAGKTLFYGNLSVVLQNRKADVTEM